MSECVVQELQRLTVFTNLLAKGAIKEEGERGGRGLIYVAELARIMCTGIQLSLAQDKL